MAARRSAGDKLATAHCFGVGDVGLQDQQQ